MNGVANINPRVVEALYTDALVLADAARGRFAELRNAQTGSGALASDGASVGLSSGRGDCPENVEVMCEALRTATRVMHCLTWLLNHRAWFAGDISTLQLRRHGRLIDHFPASDPAIVARLPADLAELVHASERLYARVARLDRAWRNDCPAVPGAIDRLRERLALSAGIM